MVDTAAFERISTQLASLNVSLVAVSKTKPSEDIRTLYHLGQRDFGENYVQELVGKQPELPDDIRWHFIGHLQRNKVRFIAPFVHLIHGVDSYRLLETVDREGARAGRRIDCLLQIHIATEETKYGMDAQEVDDLMRATDSGRTLPHIRIRGLMGMASFSDDAERVRHEFKGLKNMFDGLKYDYFPNDEDFSVLSMGMSTDHAMAIEEGSNMVRIGSLLFGAR
jgi:pyridoxal phosphate enzyme (YggS family)